MTLLEKHRDDYKTLTKRELIKIIESELERNRKRISHNVYDPNNSIRNNARRAIRKFWDRRSESAIIRTRIKKHIKVLRGLQNG